MINTEQFLNQFAAQYKKQTNNIDKIKNWIANHAEDIRIIEIAGMALGGLSILSFPLLYRSIGKFSILFAIGGSILAAISYIAYKGLDIIAAPAHKMENHAFEASRFRSASLHYQGDVPVLELNYGDKPFDTGYDHGMVMGPYINIMLKRMRELREFAKIPPASAHAHTLNKIKEKMPQEYVEEIEGMAKGYAEWAKQNPAAFPLNITFNDLLYYHMMPDSIHFNYPIEGPPHNKQAKEKNLGCSVIIDGNDKEGLTFGRSMDWDSYGIFGKYSLVINRRYKDGRASAEIGFPGFCGALTGLNKHGLALAMNVCNGDTNNVRGMPAVFFNRKCLEQAQTVQDVDKLVETASALGPYHLSAADKIQGKAYHLYQGEKDKHVTRVWKENLPLIVTNCVYKEDGIQTDHMHCSRQRHALLARLYGRVEKEVANPHREAIIRKALTLPWINNDLTTHMVLINTKRMTLEAAFDNEFAGNQALRQVDTGILFR